MELVLPRCLLKSNTGIRASVVLETFDCILFSNSSRGNGRKGATISWRYRHNNQPSASSSLSNTLIDAGRFYSKQPVSTIVLIAFRVQTKLLSNFQLAIWTTYASSTRQNAHGKYPLQLKESLQSKSILQATQLVRCTHRPFRRRRLPLDSQERRSQRCQGCSLRTGSRSSHQHRAWCIPLRRKILFAILQGG